MPVAVSITHFQYYMETLQDNEATTLVKEVGGEVPLRWSMHLWSLALETGQEAVTLCQYNFASEFTGSWCGSFSCSICGLGNQNCYGVARCYHGMLQRLYTCFC